MEKYKINRLIQYRKVIDKIDYKIVALFINRMDTIKKISTYKKQCNIPILDKKREKNHFNDCLKIIKDKKYKKYYKIIYESFLKASKLMQKENR